MKSTLSASPASRRTRWLRWFEGAAGDPTCSSRRSDSFPVSTAGQLGTQDDFKQTHHNQGQAPTDPTKQTQKERNEKKRTPQRKNVNRRGVEWLRGLRLKGFFSRKRTDRIPARCFSARSPDCHGNAPANRQLKSSATTVTSRRHLAGLFGTVFLFGFSEIPVLFFPKFPNLVSFVARFLSSLVLLLNFCAS